MMLVPCCLVMICTSAEAVTLLSLHLVHAGAQEQREIIADAADGIFSQWQDYQNDLAKILHKVEEKRLALEARLALEGDEGDEEALQEVIAKTERIKERRIKALLMMKAWRLLKEANEGSEPSEELFEQARQACKKAVERPGSAAQAPPLRLALSATVGAVADNWDLVQPVKVVPVDEDELWEAWLAIDFEGRPASVPLTQAEPGSVPPTQATPGSVVPPTQATPGSEPDIVPDTQPVPPGPPSSVQASQQILARKPLAVAAEECRQQKKKTKQASLKDFLTGSGGKQAGSAKKAGDGDSPPAPPSDMGEAAGGEHDGDPESEDEGSSQEPAGEGHDGDEDGKEPAGDEDEEDEDDLGSMKVLLTYSTYMDLIFDDEDLQCNVYMQREAVLNAKADALYKEILQKANLDEAECPQPGNGSLGAKIAWVRQFMAAGEH